MADVDHQRPRLDRTALEQLLAGLTAVRGGDFSTRLAPAGDPLIDEIAAVFNGMTEQLDQFTAEVTRVAREVGTEGKLGGQAHVPGVSGTWRDLTESVNAMAANLTAQVRNIAQVATAVARGDLTQKIEVDARGEILELKTTINTMLDQLSSFAAEATLLAAQKQDIEAKNAEISQAREETEERARQLALASQYKSQFLANMSHELRTPLNSLLILARLLAQNPGHNLTARQVEYANVIHSAGSDLLQLVNDILDLSKVEAGRMDVHAERFAVRALVEDLQATFGPLTAEKGLEFRASIEASAPAELVTDRQRLRQVLGNLLSNAVKFTERGRVTLRVTASRDEDAAVAFSVTDTGIGIAAENLATIFGAFQQGDGTLSRRYGGTGLGLSIASEVTALLGGRISTDSELGRGSTFTLWLPGSRGSTRCSPPWSAG